MTIFAPDERLSSFATLSTTMHTNARNSGVKDAFITNHPIFFIKKKESCAVSSLEFTMWSFNASNNHDFLGENIFYKVIIISSTPMLVVNFSHL